MLKNNKILATKVVQNNQEFYIGVFSLRELLSFTKFTERLIVDYDDKNLPIYNDQIQRKVDNSRVDKIVDFLLYDTTPIFPTNIVLSIPEAIIESVEEVNDKVEISVQAKIFDEVLKNEGDVYISIIDGQHRIKGIEKAKEKLSIELSVLDGLLKNSSDKKELEKKIKALNFQYTNLINIQVMVSFFIDPTLEFQAMIFSTINRTQKTVSQSLVYSLFGLTNDDSPQKSALEIVLALNSYEKSPFYNRIKLYGAQHFRNENPPLTQAGMVKSIISLICLNSKEAERDRYRRRDELSNGIIKQLPFRRYYADNDDNKITLIMYAFFTAVKEVFVSEDDIFWNISEDKPKNILNTTVGYQALIKILTDILFDLREENKTKVATYRKYLINAAKLEFKNNRRYPFTSKSKNIFYYDLSVNIWPPKNLQDERLSELGRLLV